VSLDLSAAFDTTEQFILINQLSHSFGVVATSLSWIKCYLTSVFIGQYWWPVVLSSVGVFQGSVLGPLLCHLYLIYCYCCSITRRAAVAICRRQLYIALTPSDPSSELAAIKSCLASLQLWFYTNGMALNPDKLHAILFGTTQRAQFFSGLHSIDVAGSATPLDSHIKLLGVTKTPICLCPSILSSCHSLFLSYSGLSSHTWCVRSPHCHSHSISRDLQLTQLH